MQHWMMVHLHSGAATSCSCIPVQHQEDNRQQQGQGLQVHPGSTQAREERSAMEAEDVWGRAGEAPEERQKRSSMKGVL